MRTPVYDTGKVKIGLAYTRPMPRTDQFMHEIQTGLLGINARPTPRWVVLVKKLVKHLKEQNGNPNQEAPSKRSTA